MTRLIVPSSDSSDDDDNARSRNKQKKKDNFEIADEQANNKDDVEIVGYVKPRHERTPVIVDLSSDDERHVANNDANATANRGTPAPQVVPNETINIVSSSNEESVQADQIHAEDEQDEEAQKRKEQMAIEMKARLEFKRILDAERFAKRRMKSFYPERFSKRRFKSYKEELKRQKFIDANQQHQPQHVQQQAHVEHPSPFLPPPEPLIEEAMNNAATTTKTNTTNQNAALEDETIDVTTIDDSQQPPQTSSRVKDKGKGKGKGKSSKLVKEALELAAAESVENANNADHEKRKKKSKKRRRVRSESDSSTDEEYERKKAAKRKKKKSKKKHSSTESKKSTSVKKKKKSSKMSSASSDEELPLASRWKVSASTGNNSHSNNAKAGNSGTCSKQKSVSRKSSVDDYHDVDDDDANVDLRLKLRRSRNQKVQKYFSSSSSSSDEKYEPQAHQRKVKSIVFKVSNDRKDNSSAASNDIRVFSESEAEVTES